VSVENLEAEPYHRHHTGRPWLDVLLGISAVSISLISLFLAIANGRAMERLVQSNSWPFVAIDYSNADSDGAPHIRLDIANKGVGPARIETLEVTYNGTLMNSPEAMLNAMLGRKTAPLHPHIITSTIAHGVLAAKEQKTFVDINPRDISAEDYAAIDAGLKKLSFLACYCSVFDECWMTGSGKTQPSKVKECPASSTSFR
jgi:hypothetical protein